MNKNNQATITATLAAGSTASPYFVEVNISQILCSPTCAEDTPVFNPAFSYVGLSNVGTGQYVINVHVEGVISYVPCGCGTCGTKSQLISQDFTIPLASATAPTSVTIESGVAVNSIDALGCQNCSRSFVSEVPLTITVA